jgi:hypothetical protein
VYLVDSQGRRYAPLNQNSSVPLNVLIQPGDSILATRAFEVPADAQNVGLVVDRGVGFPSCFIIGENTWFHRPPVVWLD